MTTTGDDRIAATPTSAAELGAATIALQRASRLLLARQDSQGWWSGRPEGEISLDAEGLLVREFLGIATPDLTKAVAQQIRSLQRTDGSWAGNGEPGRTGSVGIADCAELPDVGEPGYASDLSASVLAYLALRLAGDSADAYHMAVAAGWIRDAGGLTAAALSVHVWLASFGLTDWDNVPVPRPEVICLPARRNAGLGAWAGWSRPALISLAITGAARPARRLPFNLSALQVPGPAAAAHPADWRLRAGRRALRVPPMSVARSAALRSCGQWIVGWQLRPTTDGQLRPVWPGALVALYLLGYPLQHPVMADGLAWLDSVAPRLRSAVAGPRRPPVRDTVLAIGALAESGLPEDHPALVAGGQWLLGQPISGSAGRPDPQSDPAPFGWSFRNDGYPNIADTAMVLVVLSRIRLPGLAGQPSIANAAVEDALRWLVNMQGRDGGWGGSAAVTALVVQALATNGPAGSRAVRRGVVFLLRAQRADGSWLGGPGESDLYATATVLPVLLAAGVLGSKPAVVEAAQWLAGRQNLDAGWPAGTDHVAGLNGHAPSDAPGTARALTALLAARVPDLADPVDLAVDWLVRAQQADGGWSERPAGRSAPRNRGNIVPGLLRPLSALGQYVAAGGSWAEPTPG